MNNSVNYVDFGPSASRHDLLMKKTSPLSRQSHTLYMLVLWQVSDHGRYVPGG